MIVWQERAIKDVEHLSGYISQDNPVAAIEVQKRIIALTKQLGEFPFSGVTGEVTGTRQLVVQPYPYLIIYRATPPDNIEILRILHGSQQWP